MYEPLGGMGGQRRRRPMGGTSPLLMAAKAGFQGGDPMRRKLPEPVTRLPWVHSGHGYPPGPMPPSPAPGPTPLAHPGLLGGSSAAAPLPQQPAPMPVANDEQPQLAAAGLGQIMAARMKRKPAPIAGGALAY